MNKNLTTHPAKELSSKIQLLGTEFASDLLIEIFSYSSEHKLVPRGLKNILSSTELDKSVLDGVFKFFLDKGAFQESLRKSKASAVRMSPKDEAKSVREFMEEKSESASWLPEDMDKREQIFRLLEESVLASSRLYDHFETEWASLYYEPESLFWPASYYTDTINDIYEDRNPLHVIGDYYRGCYPKPELVPAKEEDSNYDQTQDQRAAASAQYLLDCIYLVRKIVDDEEAIETIILDIVVANSWDRELDKLTGKMLLLDGSSLLQVVTILRDTGIYPLSDDFFFSDEEILALVTVPLIRYSYQGRYTNMVLESLCHASGYTTKSQDDEETVSNYRWIITHHSQKPYCAEKELTIIFRIFEWMNSWMDGVGIGDLLESARRCYGEEPFVELHEFISYLRYNYTGMKIPVSIPDAKGFTNNFFAMSVFDVEESPESIMKCDLALMLLLPWEELFFWDSEEIDKDVFDRNTVSNYFYALCEKACQDNLYMLANAFMSLFLYINYVNGFSRKPLHWERLSSVVVYCLSTPGCELTETMLAAIRNDQLSSAKNINPIASALTDLSKYAPINQGKSNVIYLYKSLDIESIQAFYLNHLSTESWNLLSENSKRWLVEAERKWRIFSQHMGIETNECGSLVIEYFKTIEFELCHRFNRIFFDKTYIEHLESSGIFPPRGKLTIGPVIKLLESYDGLSRELKASIEPLGVNVKGLKPLLPELRYFVDVRNRAAHASDTSPIKLIEFRRRLLPEGGLARFMDNVS